MSTWSVTASFKQAMVTGLCVRAGCEHGILEQDEHNKKWEEERCKDRAQVSLNWSFIAYILLLLNLKNTSCWWEVFVLSIFSLDLLKKEGNYCHRKVPSLILTAGLCLKHKVECKHGNAFTFFQKHGGVARAVLDFWFGFWRSWDLQLCQISLIRDGVAPIFILRYFFLWLASRSVFLKLGGAIPFYMWKHFKSVSEH